MTRELPEETGRDKKLKTKGSGTGWKRTTWQGKGIPYKGNDRGNNAHSRIKEKE